MAEPITGTIAAVASYVSSAFAASAVGTATLAQAATVFAVNAAATVAVNVAATALLQPKVGSSGPTMDFKSDTTAPIRGVMGRMAIGGNRIFKRTWGRTNVYLTSVALLSLGPCQAVEQFKAGEQFVSFGQSQGGASGKYAGHMWMTYRYGLPGTSALTPPQGVFIENPKLTAWTSQHRADGHVTAMWTLAQAENPQKRDLYQNEPDPLWIGRWMKVWDPRQDSTYPGGSGSQRRDQWNTWAYTDNPYLHALAWIRGHAKLNADGTVDRTKRIAGVGAPERAIDIANYVEGANIADANGWKIAGEWSTSDDKWQVLAAMLQAGGGVPLNRGAQISCMVNTPRASIYTYTRNDLVGGATVKALKARRDRKNTVVPRYRSEAHGWEIVPAGAVTSSVYREEDRGEPRTIEIEYSYVTSAKQAGELGAYDVANMREGLETSLPSKPHLLGLRAGDAFTTDLPELGLVAQKFIVQRRAFDPQTGVVTLDVLSETDAKHAWALGQTENPPPTPSLVGVDPDYVAPPELPEWTVVIRPPASDGSQQPGFEIIGGSPAADASSVVMEHGQSPTGPWKQFYDGALKTTGRVPIDGLQPGEVYYVAVRYRRDSSGALSERTIYGPYTAPSLTAGDTAAVAGYPASDLLKDVQNVETLAGQTRDAVAGLEQVYGDTVSAAQSAADAAAAQAGAIQAKADAVIAQGAARTAAEDALAKAQAAAGSSAAADAAKTASETARDAAIQKALDAAGAAETAGAAQSAAETASADAAAEALKAAQKAGEASGSAQAAAGSAGTASSKATEAGTSAAAALASSVTATTAKDAAVAAAIAGFPDTLAADLLTAQPTGSPTTVPSLNAALFSAAGIAPGVGGFGTALYKQTVPWKSGEVYEFDYEVEGLTGTSFATVYGQFLNASFAATTERALAYVATPNGVKTRIVQRVALDRTVAGATTWTLAGTGTDRLRFGVIFNRTNTGPAASGQARLTRMTVRNVTGLVDSQSVYDKTVILGGNQGFEEGLTGWASRANMTDWLADASRPTYLASFEGRAHVAKWNAGAYGQAFMAKRFPIDTARKYIIRGRAWASGAGASIRIAIQARNDAGSEVPGAYQYRQHIITSSGAGWVEIATPIISGEGNLLSNFHVGTKAIQIGILSNATGAAVETALDGIWIEDVTESEAAKSSATAAATSAASAAASETAAGQSATAANQSKLDAQTAQAEASNSATNAAKSATTATGAAATATTQAGLATTARDQSQGHAAAASGSAELAGAKADAAGVSAEAARADRVAAEAAREGAEGSASASASSASSAAADKTAAGSSASAAQTARTGAETARGQAQTYASNASDSADDAAGAASTATQQAGLATTARNAAEGSAAAAAGSASTASSKADAAGQSATAAEASRVAAKSSQDAAKGSADAASTSASTAATKATEAGTSASAANTAKTAAETARSQAQTFRDEASDSADDANGAAATATQQAGLATTARNEAAGSASAALTSRNQASGFATAAETAAAASSASSVTATASKDAAKNYAINQGSITPSALLWTNNPNGAPETATDATYPVVTVGGKPSMILGDNQHVFWKRAVPFVAGHVYEIQVEVEPSTASAAEISLIIWQLDGSYANLPAQNYQLTSKSIPVRGLYTQRFTPNAATVWLRPAVKGEMVGSKNPRIFSLNIIDVTAQAAAEASATAASTSASSAAASETAAGQSASAANTAKVAAETARGQAQTAATNAATSETNAAGSAASASTAAQNAATSRDQASGFATAASGSASTASTKAGEAGTSAAAALASQVSASTAKGAAETARDVAQGKAGEAASSASAAATSASNAAASETAAGQKASAAEGSATTAATRAGEAQTYRNQASSSAADAATASINAGVSASSAASRAGGNVVAMGSFSDGTIGTWTGSVANVAVSGVPDGSTRALRSTGRDAYEGSLIPGVWGGRRLRVSGYGVAPGPYPFRIGIHGQTAANGSHWVTTVASSANTTSWATISGEIVVPANVNRLRPFIQSEGPQGATDHHVQVATLRIEDVTESASAANSAAVATSQAASASASAAAASISANLAAAISAPRGQLLYNSTGNRGMDGWAGAGWYTQDVGYGFGRAFRTNTTGTFFHNDVAHFAGVAPNDWVTWSADPQVFNGTCDIWLEFYDGGFNRIGPDYARRQVTNRDFGSPISGEVVAPPNALNARLVVWPNFTAGGSAGIRRMKVERGQLPATAWSDEETTKALSASLAITSAVAVDAQTRLASARFEVIAAAGNDPAQLLIRADTSGSLARMVASSIGFANVVGGQVIEAMKLIGGEVFFMRPIYIDVGDKRLIVGPGGTWVLWFGNNDKNAAAASRTNGYFALGTDGQVYLGGLSMAGGFRATSDTGFIGGGRTGAGHVQTSNTVNVTVSGGTSGTQIRWIRISGDTRIRMNDEGAFSTGAYATIGTGEAITAYFMGLVTRGSLQAVVYVQVDLADTGT